MIGVICICCGLVASGGWVMLVNRYVLRQAARGDGAAFIGGDQRGRETVGRDKSRRMCKAIRAASVGIAIISMAVCGYGAWHEFQLGATVDPTTHNARGFVPPLMAAIVLPYWAVVGHLVS